MPKKEIINIIKKYIAYLYNDGIKVEKAILFGSYVKKNNNKDSDIDVLIISKSFGKNRVKEGQELFKRTRFIDARIEPIPVTLKEYNTGSSPLINEIKKYGITVE